MSYVPQLDNVFQSLTMDENLQMGALEPGRGTGCSDVRALPPARRAPRSGGWHDERQERQMVAMHGH